MLVHTLANRTHSLFFFYVMSLQIFENHHHTVNIIYFLLSLPFQTHVAVETFDELFWQRDCSKESISFSSKNLVTVQEKSFLQDLAETSHLFTQWKMCARQTGFCGLILQAVGKIWPRSFSYLLWPFTFQRKYFLENLSSDQHCVSVCRRVMCFVQGLIWGLQKYILS